MADECEPSTSFANNTQTKTETVKNVQSEWRDKRKHENSSDVHIVLI